MIILKFNKCNKGYVEQTRRNFKAMHKEQVHDTRHYKENSKYGKHLLDTQHECGKIEDFLNIMSQRNKHGYLVTILHN